MKFLKSYYSIIIILFITALVFIGYGCSNSQKAVKNDEGLGSLGDFKVEKSGAVLWGENCGNCHNAPDPAAFNDKQWKTLGKHMQMRAGLTAEEVEKVVTFLQQSN